MGKLKTKHSVAEGKARVLPLLAHRTTIVDLVYFVEPAAAASSFDRLPLTLNGSISLRRECGLRRAADII